MPKQGDSTEKKSDQTSHFNQLVAKTIRRIEVRVKVLGGQDAESMKELYLNIVHAMIDIDPEINASEEDLSHLLNLRGWNQKVAEFKRQFTNFMN